MPILSFIFYILFSYFIYKRIISSGLFKKLHYTAVIFWTAPELLKLILWYDLFNSFNFYSKRFLLYSRINKICSDFRWTSKCNLYPECCDFNPVNLTAYKQKKIIYLFSQFSMEKCSSLYIIIYSKNIIYNKIKRTS